MCARPTHDLSYKCQVSSWERTCFSSWKCLHVLIHRCVLMHRCTIVCTLTCTQEYLYSMQLNRLAHKAGHTHKCAKRSHDYFPSVSSSVYKHTYGCMYISHFTGHTPKRRRAPLETKEGEQEGVVERARSDTSPGYP